MTMTLKSGSQLKELPGQSVSPAEASIGSSFLSALISKMSVQLQTVTGNVRNNLNAIVTLGNKDEMSECFFK